MALHFVGFRDERYWAKDPHYQNAVRLFGKPDFYHRRWDMRAYQEIAPDDTVIWANHGDGLAECLPPYLTYTFDDSHQDIVANGGAVD